MELSLGFYLLLGVSILCSALFSAIELSFFSASRLRMAIDGMHPAVVDRVIAIYQRNPSQFIACELVGNNVSLVVYGMLMVRLLAPFLEPLQGSGGLMLLAQTLISTAVILLLGEFIPKVVVRPRANAALRLLALPNFIFFIILYPVGLFITWLTNRMLRLFSATVAPKEGVVPFGKLDLNQLVEQATDGDETPEGVYGNPLRIFSNALDFSQVKLRDCMVPRTEVVALEIGSTIEQLLALLGETRYSRILVYEGTIDNIVGYVNAKSLFGTPATIAEILLPLPLVPETMAARVLLQQFIKTNATLAVVLDEFGGTAGLVTREDLLEEIFGEIEDEHDQSDELIRQVGSHEYLLSGRAEVELVNRTLSIDIPEGESYDTIAGWILQDRAEIPKAGESFHVDDFRITVEEVDANRILLVRLRVS